MEISIAFLFLICEAYSVKGADAPYQALVQFSTWRNMLDINSCGGVLIDQRYVLTAASCATGADVAHVMLGIKDLYGNSAISREVEEIVIHPNYSTDQNNIALLKMRGVPVPENTNGVEIIKIGRDIVIGSEGTNGTLSGWQVHGTELFVVTPTFVKFCDRDNSDICTYGTYCLAAGSALVVNDQLIGISKPPTYCDGTVACTKVSDYLEWINENISTK